MIKVRTTSYHNNNSIPNVYKYEDGTAFSFTGGDGSQGRADILFIRDDKTKTIAAFSSWDSVEIV